MKPGDETPQNWQQPAENLPQAPYQAPVEQPITPPAAVPPVVPTPQSIQQPTPLPVSPPTPVPTPSLGTELSQVPVAESAPTEPPVTVSSLDASSYQQDEFDEEEEGIDEQPVDTLPSDDDTALLRWQATEYIHHERTGLWYAVLGLVVVLFVVLAIFVFHSVTFAILIPVMLVALVVYVRRPPSVLNYILSRKGLHVNDRLYTYDQFKAFGVITHEGMHSVVLLPRKRFQVSQTIYFPEEVGEPLVDMIAARLPMQEVELDAIDKLLKKLRI